MAVQTSPTSSASPVCVSDMLYTNFFDISEPYIHIAAESPSDRSLTASYERLDDIPIREDIVHPNGIPFPHQRTPHTSDAKSNPNDRTPIESPPKGLPDVHIVHTSERNRDAEINSESQSASAPPSPPRGPADLRLSVSTVSLSHPRRDHRYSSDRDRDRDRTRRRHTYDSHHDRPRRSGGGRRHTNSSSKPHREFERILLSVSAHSKDMRQVLRSALDQLEESRSRATRAERLALELTQRSREANDERLSVVRQGGATREELGMYKIQLTNAQAEIARAQEMLKVHEEMRRDAEATAARARDTARKLEQDRLVRLAREEGRKLGFREGLRAGKRVGFYDGREEGYNEERRRRPNRVDEDDRDISDEEQAFVGDSGAEEPMYEGYPPYHDPMPAETDPPGLNDREVPSQNDLTVPGPSNSEVLDNVQTLPQSPPPRPRRYTPRRQDSRSGSDSTSTLPLAARDINPNNLGALTRAPRLPTPNIPSPIPEVVNTEPSSSRTPSQRGSGYIDEHVPNVQRSSSSRSHRSHRSHRDDRDATPVPGPSHSSHPILAPITPESMVGYNEDQQGGYVRGPPPHPPPPAMVNDRGNPGSTPGPRMTSLRRNSVNEAAQDGAEESSGDDSENMETARRTLVKQDIADYIRGDGADQERRMAAHRVRSFFCSCFLCTQ